MFEIVESVDEKKWSKFVYDNPNGNIFQTPEMAEVYKSTKRVDPVTLFAIRDNKIFASLLAYVSKEKEGFLGRFATRAIIQGGPLFLDGKEGHEAVSLLLDELDRRIEKDVLFTEVRMLPDISKLAFLENKGYKFEEHLNFLIDLGKPINEVWGSVHKSMRKNIRRAKETGIKIEEMKDKKLIRTFYKILKETYDRVKHPLFDITLFESAFDILVPKKMAKFHLANYENDCIGCRASLLYKGVIYAWYVGTLRKFSRLNANPLLNWNIIEWGTQNKYQTFNFCGAGKPGEKYGIREFKEQFGGRLVNYGRYCKVYSNSKMIISKAGLKIYKKLAYR